jgi:hypothetical protein
VLPLPKNNIGRLKISDSRISVITIILERWGRNQIADGDDIRKLPPPSSDAANPITLYQQWPMTPRPAGRSHMPGTSHPWYSACTKAAT